MTQNSLLVGIAGSGKTRRCVERGLQVLESGGRLVCLVPNREEAQQLRRRLLEASGREALFLPEIQHFNALADRVLESAGLRLDRRDRLSRHLHLARLLAERAAGLGPLAESAATPGFQEILDRFFRELDEGDLRPEDLAAAAGTRGEALAGLYAEFLRRQDEDGRLDGARLMARAAACLESEPGLLGAVDLLILDGFSSLSPLQLRFFEALLPAAKEALLSVCLDPADLERGEAAPFERPLRLARRFAGREGWRVESLDGSRRHRHPFLREAAARLFRERGDGEAEGALDLYEAATPRDEAEGVLRELRHELTRGTPPERMAVLFRDPAYEPLLAQVLGEEGIPFHLELSAPVADRRAASALLDLLDACRGAPVPDLPQRLRGGFVGTDDACLAALQAEARARGVPGARPWREFLDEARAAHPDEDWDWLDLLAAAPDGELAGEDWLEKLLLPALRMMESQLAAELREILASGDGDLRRRAADLEVFEAVEAAARGLVREAGPAGARRSPAAWLRHLRRALECVELTREVGAEGGGVILGDPARSRLPELEAVFVCGLSQGGFPPAFSEHPLLRESERQALNRRLGEDGRDARLMLWPDRQADERYLFYVAATRPSRRLMISWPLRDTQGRERPRSAFVEELARLGLLPAPRPLPPLSLPGKLADPVRAEDLVRDALLARRRRERHPLAARALEFVGGREELAGELRREERREEPLEGHAALAPHLERFAKISASGLEKFADCPYRFLMEKLLGMEKEEDYEPGAAEEGSLYHKTLELFYRAWTGGRPSGEELAAHYERACEALADETPALLSPRFRAEDPRRLAVLERFLEKDIARIETSGFAPLKGELERSFTLKSEELPGAGDEERFDLHGLIDRVDGCGERRVIIDYKRSDKMLQKDGEPQRQFQLALYAMGWGASAAGAAYAAIRAKGKALRGHFREDLKGSFEDWGVGRGGCRWHDEDAWREWLENTATRIREIVGDIRAGRLEANPVEEDTCKWCHLKQVCRWRWEDAKGGGRAD